MGKTTGTMTTNDLPYPLRLCVELLGYAGVSCAKTQNMTASEIKQAAAVFFDDEMIAEASAILCGKPLRIYSGGKVQEYSRHLCPSTGREDCSMCSGEYCATHFNRPCDCDTAERHIADRD